MTEEIKKLFPPVRDVQVKPWSSTIYTPPLRFEGSALGHMGEGHLFLYLEKGAMFVLIGKRAYILRPGQLAFLPDGVFRAYVPTTSDYVLHAYTMYIAVEDAELFRFLNLCSDSYVVNVPDPQELTAHFRRISTRRAHADTTLYLLKAADALEIAATYISARIWAGHVEKPFENVVDYMRAHLDGNLVLDDLARLANMHPTHFIRRFKSHYHVAPMHYYAELRLQRALELLAEKDASVSAVGRAIGFSDKNYFIKFFQRICGLTPDDYKKLLRQTS